MLRLTGIHTKGWLTTILLLAVVCVSVCGVAQVDEWTIEDENRTTDRSIEIANAMWYAGQTAKAEELFISAYEKAMRPNERLDAAKALTNFYKQQNKTRQAIAVYEKMLNDDNMAQNPHNLMHIYDGLGKTYDAEGQYKKAIKSYRMADAILKRHAEIDSVFASHLYTDMAKTLLQAGDVNEAQALVDTALTFSEMSDYVTLSEIISTKSRVLASLGEYEKAYAGMEQTIALNQKHWDSQVNTLINSTNPLYAQQRNETKKKYEKQLQELSSRLEDTESLKNKAIGATIGIGLFAVMCVFGFMIAIKHLRDEEKRRRTVEQKYRDSQRVISIVSHDAITQFNALLGFASIQMEKAQEHDEDNEQKEFRLQIFNSAQRLYQMMSNLLTWSKTKSQLKPKMEVINVGEKLQRTLDVCRIIASEKNIRIVNKIGNDINAYVDPGHLEIVIRNLITNAIKFTQKNGEITLQALTHSDRTSIVVEDNGVGMDETMVNNFNSNVAIASTNGTEHEKGNGLGLSICRDLVLSNEGEIIINSEQDKGTSVTIVLRRG